MQIYCSACKKHTYNACPKQLVMIANKIIKGKSGQANCMTIRLFIDKIKYKDELEIYLQFLMY